MGDQYTVEDFDRFSKQLNGYVDTFQLTPIALLIVAAGLLLSSIRACRGSGVFLPSDLVKIEPLLESLLHKAVPVAVASQEELDAARAASREKAH